VFPLKPRSERIKNIRTTLYKESVFNFIKKGLIASILLVSSSQLVGYTYAQFTDTDEAEAQMSTCEVFPSHINSLLQELVQHLDAITNQKRELNNYSIVDAPTDNKPPFLNEEFSSTELSNIASQLSQSIETLQDAIQINQNSVTQIKEHWQVLSSEVHATTVLLNKVSDYIENIAPNCLELKQTSGIESLSKIDTSPLHSDARNVINEIVVYFNQIHIMGDDLEKEGTVASNQITQTREEINELSNHSLTALVLHPEQILNQEVLDFHSTILVNLVAMNSALSKQIANLDNLKEEATAAATKKLEEEREAEEKRKKEKEDQGNPSPSTPTAPPSEPINETGKSPEMNGRSLEVEPNE
jgi:hypothetical protein